MNPSSTVTMSATGLGRGPSMIGQLFYIYEWVARRQTLACAVVLFLTLGIRAALLPWWPPPLPTIHDEFSYLLAGDTYASGRLANPAHPMWVHFETFHELMQPVYTSRYPSLQGMILAFGQKFFGDPWVGVFLSTGLMSAAICWMLQGWVTPNLAFLGGLLVTLHIGVFGYWMNSYWGGSATAVGGALALGAMIRIWRRRQAGHWITLAIGLALLMHSRPWEGGVLAVEIFCVLAWAWRKSPSDFRPNFFRAAAPAAAILLMSLGALFYINHRVTGSALLMPSNLYWRQYAMTPVFAFVPLREEQSYRHPLMHEQFGVWEAGLWRETRFDPVNTGLKKISDLYVFFFGLWPLLIPPLIWPYRLKTPEERVTVILLLGFLVIALLPLITLLMHYVAPIAGLLYVRFLQTLSRLNKWRPAGKPLGAAVGVFFVTLFFYQFAFNLNVLFRLGVEVSPFALARDATARELADKPGRQLVFVRYAPDHRFHDEWVWNRADIDGSQTVWARFMGAGKDRELLDYYHDRQPDRKAWLLEPDKKPLRLVPYPEKDSAQ